MSTWDELNSQAKGEKRGGKVDIKTTTKSGWDILNSTAQERVSEQPPISVPQTQLPYGGTGAVGRVVDKSSDYLQGLFQRGKQFITGIQPPPQAPDPNIIRLREPPKETIAESFKEGLTRGVLSTGSVIERIASIGAKKVGLEDISNKLDVLSNQDRELAKAGIDVTDVKKFSEGIRDPNWIARGIGQNLPNMLAAMGASIPAVAVGAPGAVIGAISFASAGLLEGGFAYEDALEFGVDEKTAGKVASIVGVANGILEALPITKLLTRTKAGAGIKRSIIREITKRVVSQAGLEAGTESLQEIVSNAVAKVYDKSRDLLSGVPESAFFGGIMGGGISTVADVAGIAGQKTQEDITPTLEQATVPAPKEQAEITPVEERVKEARPRTWEEANKTVEKAVEKKVEPEAKPTPKEPLAQEAKKYKNAEEFVKAQEVVYRGGKADGKYFSTSKNIAEDFVKERGGVVSEKIISPNAKVISYSDFPNAKYKGINDYNVNTFSQGKDLKTFQDTVLEADYIKAEKWAKENSYDVIKFPTEAEVRVVNQNVLQSKSQLTEIYNQAKTVKEVKPQAKPVSKKIPTKVSGKVSGIARSVEAKAIEQGFIKRGYDQLAEFDSSTIKEQSNMIASAMKKDIEKVKDIVSGREPLPAGMKPATPLSAMEDYAIKTGDADLMQKLANSPLATQISEAGSELSLSRIRKADSATARLNEIKKAREAKVRNLGSKKTKASKSLKTETTKTNLSKTELSWDNFLSKIIC